MIKRTIALLTAAVICMHSFAADGNKSGNPDPASRSGFSVRAGIGLTATRGNANLNSTACAWGYRSDVRMEIRQTLGL